MHGVSISGWTPLGALRRSSDEVAASMMRLATGKKVSRAADAPADMVAIENLKVDDTRLTKEIEGLERSSLRLSARDGALSVIDDLVTELHGLAVAAASTGATSDSERRANQQQADSILQTITFLAGSTVYNGERILEGLDPATMGRVEGTDEDGASTGYTLADLGSGGRLTLYGDDPELAERVAKSAEEGIWMGRAAAGAEMKQNDSRVRALLSQREGEDSIRSLLEDTDMAAEVSRLVRAQTMQQAALYATTLSRHSHETVLTLLQGVRK
jgi:flagellin